MPIPSPIKIKKNNVEYTSNVDRINYTMTELSRAALRDVGKFVVKRARQRISRVTGRLVKNTQYWVKKSTGELQVGFKRGGFYGIFQEIGTQKIPKIGALTNTVNENIAEIRKIESQYLSAIQDVDKAQSLISEGEYLED